MEFNINTTMSSSSFPKYFLLFSNLSKHIQHVNELEEHRDSLVCDEQDVGSLHSRFQVEKSEGVPNGFHIRCCYNNSYWALHPDGHVYAGEKQKVEDTNQSNCTLFRLNRGDSGKEGAFQLICLQNNEPLGFVLLNSKMVLAAATTPHDFTALDSEALVVLPRYVSFKGDNGKYLQVVKNNYLQHVANDRHYESARFEVLTTPDGRVRVKNGDKFWRAGPNWIYCDSSSRDDDYSDPATLFMPYRIEKNVIALRNVANNYFCRRTTWDYHDDCLCADNAGITISKGARLEVEEPLLSREISDIRFREEDCRNYNESIVTMAKAFVTNDTKKFQNIVVKLEYEHATSHTWTTGYSSSYTGKMGFEFQIPSFIDIKHESSTQKGNSYEWGKKMALVERKTRSVTVPVKPGRKVEVTVEATRRCCDVPFTYTQEDKLENGASVNPEYMDGIYTGDYCMDFHDRVDEVND